MTLSTPQKNETKEMQMEMLNSKTLKHAFLVLILAASFGTLGGCATVEGAGKDIQSAGEAIEEGAEEASN
jgi:predicted small secreted protein